MNSKKSLSQRAVEESMTRPASLEYRTGDSVVLETKKPHLRLAISSRINANFGVANSPCRHGNQRDYSLRCKIIVVLTGIPTLLY